MPHNPLKRLMRRFSAAVAAVVCGGPYKSLKTLMSRSAAVARWLSPHTPPTAAGRFGTGCGVLEGGKFACLGVVRFGNHRVHPVLPLGEPERWDERPQRQALDEPAPIGPRPRFDKGTITPRVYEEYH